MEKWLQIPQAQMDVLPDYIEKQKTRLMTIYQVPSFQVVGGGDLETQKENIKGNIHLNTLS